MRRGRLPGERGIVSIELCVGFVLATMLTAVLVGASLLGVAQATTAESAAQVARQAARGDEVALQSARERAPEGATIELERHATGVQVVVTMPVSLLAFGTVDVSARAWAAYEPGIGS